MLRNPMRTLAPLVTGALTLGLVVAVAPPAQAEDMPIIGGTVTDAEDAPLAGVCVSVFDAERRYVGGAATGSDGTYLVWAGSDGSYRVRFSTDGCAEQGLGNYQPEWYDDAASFEESAPVLIEGGVGPTAIDAVLAEGATISGQVSDEAGEVLPAPYGCVDAYDADDERASYAQADETGAYTLERLIPGQDYRLLVTSCGAGNYTQAWYEDATSFATATPVTATAEGVTGINQSVPTGGRILGKAIDDLGAPITTQTCIEIYDAAAPYEAGQYVTASVVYPHAEGAFEAYGLPTGSYKLFFYDCDDAGLASEWYEDRRTFGAATSVAVVAGQDTTDVVAVLGPPDTTDPETTITAGPAQGATVDTSTVSFAFTSNEAKATFTCELDDRPLADCTSPITLRDLGQGAHTFTVGAVDAAGNVDRTPVRRSFSVAVPDLRCAAAGTSLAEAKADRTRHLAKVARLKKKLAQADRSRPSLKRKLAKARADVRADRRDIRRARVQADRFC
jgi:hypothetical protein